MYSLNFVLSKMNKLYMFFLTENWLFSIVISLCKGLVDYAAETMNEIVRTLFRIENH